MIIYKTPAEIEKMRRAGQVLFEAMKAVKAAVRPGVTTAELDRIAEEAIRAAVQDYYDKNGIAYDAALFREHDCAACHGG